MRALALAGAVLLAGLAAAAGAAEPPTNPYSGQQQRAIKALSQQDISELRSGAGMGMAKAAELNGYPGPRHVLDLSRELALSEAQQRAVAAVKERMSDAARPLGAELIERERALDQLFARREATPQRLTQATSAIGDIQARLRAVHLAAHIETRALLNEQQLARYDALRGYAEHRAEHGHAH